MAPNHPPFRLPALARCRVTFSMRLVWIGVLAALTAVTACRRTEVTQTRVPKAAPASPEVMTPPGMPSQAVPPGGMPPTGMPPPGMSGMGSMGSSPGDLPPPPLPSGPNALKWKLPKGWTESGASGMRYATLKPGVPGRVDVSVVVLSGEAGGELANVNRWRGQIGLGPIDEAALSPARQRVKSPAGTVSVYDFTSEGQTKTRLVVGLINANGGSWFLKMVGDAGPVGTTRPDFLRWLETLRFDATNN